MMQPLPEKTPLDTQTVSVNGQDYTARDVLVRTQALAATPDDPDYNAFMDASRNIVRGYGFRTGALGTEDWVRNIADPAERTKYVTGNDNAPKYSGQLLVSIYHALNTDTMEMVQRQGVFTPDSNGRYGYDTTLPDGTNHRIEIKYTGDVAHDAVAVGVSQAETLAKIDWRVWQRTLDTAANTQAQVDGHAVGIDSVTITGAWRPYEGLTTYQGKLFGSSPYLENGNRISWDNMMRSPHISGRGLDIGMINNISIENASGNKSQNELVKQFSYNLRRAEGVTQVIQPWMTFGLYGVSSARPTMGDTFVKNAGLDPRFGTDLERIHLNHLHVSYFW